MAIRELRFEINSQCNLRCQHCYTDKTRQSTFTIKQFEDILAQNPKLERLSITGGEPLLSFSKLVQFSRLAHEKGLIVRVNTNGTLLSDEKLDQLKKSGVHELQISLSGADEVEFNRFAGAPIYQKIISSIARSVSKGFYITIRYSLSPHTAKDIYECYRLMSQLGVNLFKVRTSVETAGNEGFKTLDFSDFNQIKVRIKNLQAELGTPISIKYSQDDSGFENKCGCGVDSVFLSTDGKIFSCQFLRESQSLCLGDVMLQEKLEPFLESPINKKFLEREMACCTSAEFE